MKKPNLPKSNQITAKKIGNGLVFGKFLPLHEGHLYLLNFAQKSCHRLTILVCTLKSEPIPGEIRFRWVKDLFPTANVVHHYDEIPQEPKEHSDFWNIWRQSIKRHCPDEEFDCLFGSEDYGWRMAKEMGIEYIPVNRVRSLVPISGTAMRKNPMKNWAFLPQIVHPYFVKRVCLVGPESTGKSILAQKLAAHYQTVFVEEYARSLLDEYVQNRGYQGGEVKYPDIATIARGQIATEDSLALRANRVIFCDTDLITTVYWSHYYFKKCLAWVKKEAETRKYDLYLLLDTDTPYVKDAQRPMTKLKDRQEFHQWWQIELKKRKRKFLNLQGNWDERFEKARQAVDQLLKEVHP